MDNILIMKTPANIEKFTYTENYVFLPYNFYRVNPLILVLIYVVACCGILYFDQK